MRLTRTIVILAVFTLLLLVGCATPRAVRLASHGASPGASSPAAVPSGSAVPTSPSAASASAASPDYAPPEPASLEPASPGPSASGAGTSGVGLAEVGPFGAAPTDPAPTDPALADPALASFLAQLPRFAPPPPPRPVAVPVGPAVPIYTRLPVDQPVAFLTMDDGWTQLPEAIPLMRAAHIPFTMFLIAPVAAGSPAFFDQLRSAGGVVEDHTINHPELRGRAYASQRDEICGARDSLVRTFGTGPSLFRPPYGDYDSTTLRVAHDCGLRVAVDWSETVDSGTIRYQTNDHRIRPGDIILMHFRPAFVRDVIAALTAIHDAGLTPALLESYLS
ncbi:hypothetical protein GCM10023322_83690 [Rugosimonospora acidiphila]|uniref:NodB homology domain-containing protein n=1 Tax=Rugosimonospora acidiphila TaxID=556531 RepID=A0ABP9SU97_9ACTN